MGILVLTTLFSVLFATLFLLLFLRSRGSGSSCPDEDSLLPFIGDDEWNQQPGDPSEKENSESNFHE